MNLDETLRAHIGMLIRNGSVLAEKWDTAAPEDVQKLLGQIHAHFAQCENVVETLSPDRASPYRRRLAEVSDDDVPIERQLATFGHMLAALRHDVGLGLTRQISAVAQVEVVDDFIDQADHYLRGNKVGPAGVIVGVVFEDTIRRACERLGIEQKDVELEQLITALEKIGAIEKVKAKRARAAAHVRTKATHAQWEEFDVNDVEAALRFTREMIDRLLT
jgi:hypothetical protein